MNYTRSNGTALGVCLWLAVGLLPARGSAQEKLACAVHGTVGQLTPESLCEGLGRELGRPTTRADDARKVPHGDAVQIIHDDLTWTVAWLRNGQLRAWTRVSQADAAGREVLFLARASRALSRAAQKPSKACLRIEPNGGRKMRSDDLAYPWVELRQCRVQPAELVDPWWSSPT